MNALRLTYSPENEFQGELTASFFADWKNDPLLAEAYEDALLWSNKSRQV